MVAENMIQNMEKNGTADNKGILWNYYILRLDFIQVLKRKLPKICPNGTTKLEQIVEQNIEQNVE